MAELYLARTAGAASTDPLLVIKRMLPDLANDPTFVEMFLAEARITAQLVHPNIVSVVDINEQPGNYFYAMEYVRGSDLLVLVRALARQHRTVPLECAVAIGIGVCAALEHAHALTDRHNRALNIVHRDVSLGNILVGYDGSVKLVDFGVVRHGGRAATEPGILKGKLGYMSPEQALGAPIDRRSDLFALGIVLYEITTGERLFPPCDRDEASLARIVRCKITPPSELMFEYPLDLAAIVMTALARDPAERYASAREMKCDLQAWLRVHGKSGAPSVIAELVTRTFAIASPRPGSHDSTELDALVGSLPPRLPRTISTDIVPVSPSDPAPRPPTPRTAARPRSRVPAMAAIACVFAGIVISAWAAWTHVHAPEQLPTLATVPSDPAIEIIEPAALRAEEPAAPVAIAQLASLAVRGAVPATVAGRDTKRVLDALRACYRSPARDRGDDVEVAFELVDSRITTRVGTRRLERLAGCAQRAAGLLADRAVVVTITFRPS